MLPRRCGLISSVLRAAVMTICCILAVPGLAHEKQTLRVESEAWEGATNSDGTGLYWDILRAIYEPEGFSLSFNVSSYMRSVGLVKMGQTDIMVGAYADEIEEVTYPAEFFDVDRIYAMSRLAREDLPGHQAWQGEASLEGRQVGYIKGYELIEYISVPFYAQEFHNRTIIMRMLMSDRLDYFLDAQEEINSALKMMDYSPDLFRFQPVKVLPLYFTFQNNEQGQRLAIIHDRRLKALKDSGALKVLFDKWDEDYPFEE